MEDKTSKIIAYVLWGLIGISVLLTAMFYLDWVNETILLNWTYALLAVAALSSIIFPILVLVQDPKKAKGTLISLVGLLAVLGLAYVVASGEVLMSYEKYGVDESTSKLVGMGIIATYTLLLISSVGIFFFGIMQAVKS